MEDVALVEVPDPVHVERGADERDAQQQRDDGREDDGGVEPEAVVRRPRRPVTTMIVLATAGATAT